MITGCGFRKSVALFDFLNETLCWGMEEIPCRNSVENWIKKSGYFIYENPRLKASDGDYGLIIDESIMLGNERMILSLGVDAEKSEQKPLDYNDIEVIGIHVDTTWDASKITGSLREDEKKMAKRPEYIISDNDNKLCKAIADYGCTHIRDIGHTLAMFLKRVYGKEPDFVSFFKRIGRLKITEAMSDCSYLLPPRQRTIACFMNLSATVSWARKVIGSFPSFTAKEKRRFRFVLQNERLISELESVFESTNRIFSIIKTAGLSYDTAGAALAIIKKEEECKTGRVGKIISLTTSYLLEEAIKLNASDSAVNASSDMIESAFGCYKLKKSKNAPHGVTAYVLILPLATKMKESGKGLDTDFKANLENIYMRDLKQWTNRHLTENQTIKRKNKLAA